MRAPAKKPSDSRCSRVFVFWLVFGKRKVEARARAVIRRGPQPAAMVLNDGQADRQSNPHSTRLRRVESFKDPGHCVWVQTDPRIFHRDLHLAVVIDVPRGNRQLPLPVLDAAHRVPCIHGPLQQYVLQLRSIFENGRKVVRRDS